MQRDHFSAGPAGDDRHLPMLGEQQVADRRVPTIHRAQQLSPTVLSDEQHDDIDDIDLLAYWRLLVSRRWLILGVISAVAALALIYTLLTPPTYRATAVLQIDTEGMQVMQVQGISPIQGVSDRQYYQTQYELLKSRALAERVVEDLNLVGSDIFQSLQPASWFERLRGLLSLGAPATNQPGPQRVANGAAPPPANADAAERRRATVFIQDGLVIEPVRDSHLVRIHYDSLLPTFSARVANAIADGFIASSMDQQFGASSYAKKYLEDQLAQLKSRLEDSERTLVDFAQKENIVPSANGASLEAQNLSDLNASLAKAQDQRIRAEARWNQAKAVSGAALPADMLADTVLRNLQEQRAKLQGDYQEKAQTFKPDYPTMLALKGQIDEVQKQVVNELANIRASVKAEYDAAASQEKILEKQLANLRAQTLDVDSRSIQYNIFKREVDTNRQLYNALLQRYKEVGMAGGVKSSNLSIVDHAEVPARRYAPSISLNLAVGLLVGAMLGVMLALLLEYLDDTLKTPLDIEQRLHLAVLGIVPKLTKQSPYNALKDPRSAFSESYRSVRTALQFSTDRGVPKVLLITSPAANEGKSTSALTLAQNFTQLGKRVLLIEGDLRNPTLNKILCLSPQAGLSSLLAGAATLAQTVLKTDDERLDVILSGPLPPSPTELLAGPKLASLLLTGAEKYDQIIIDAPPVLGIADAPILANAAEGTLLIIKSGSTGISAAQSAIKRLKAARGRLIGCLLTQYDAQASGYGYGNYYAYGETRRLSGK
ncbi:polysaccharide biosynthesis tyrosine autokinase [Dokdonella soli]|uniref:non-specific protein-tyrosine kinase n=1 Tax=Dokdonella soli TaxID=529810 RepID=A0ABN1ID72_9GAMM